MGILDFFSPEAGQSRRRWLNEQEKAFGDALAYYLGPAAGPVQSAGLLAGYMTPGADMMDASNAGRELFNADTPMDAATAAATAIAAGGMMLLPGNVGALREGFDQSVNALAAYDPVLARSGFGPTSAADEIQSALSARYPGVSLSISRDGDGIALNRIVVPQDMRNQGVGSAVMRDLVNMARERGLRVGLTPSADFGGNVNRLRNFYSGLGFRPNAGSRRDFGTRETMILDWLDTL